MVSTKGLLAVALLAWAGFFAWLAVSGEMTRYLGPRTYWVVWFGAVVLGLAAFSNLIGYKRWGTGRVSWRDLLGAAVLVAPMLAVVAVPSPELGALAASRKAAGVGAIASLVPPPPSDGEIGLAEIHYASESGEYAAAVGIVEGAPVELVGFVTPAQDGPPGAFALTRFYISCCAADAIPYSAIVLPDGSKRYEIDSWLEVTGTLESSDAGYLVVPGEVTEVPKPKNPYLY